MALLQASQLQHGVVAAVISANAFLHFANQS
jgi:hypothetical protein